MIESLVSEVCFEIDTSKSLCVDSGAANNICNSFQGFRETGSLSGGEIIVNMGSEAKAEAVSMGVVVLYFQILSLFCYTFYIYHL